ncbi:MAG: hypothetical protein WEA56_16955 [Balneolaceae bacterium]
MTDQYHYTRSQRFFGAVKSAKEILFRYMAQADQWMEKRVSEIIIRLEDEEDEILE